MLGALRVSFEYIKDTILISNTLVTVIESTFDGDIVGDLVDNSGLTEVQKLERKSFMCFRVAGSYMISDCTAADDGPICSSGLDVAILL